MMNLLQACTALPGASLVGDGQRVFTRVHSDTRSLRSGDLFVALKGDNFDGNRFLAQARDAGAAAALVHRGSELAQVGLPGIEVDDSKKALGTLAQRWRERFTLPLIAVTGSNGKTTVTQMLAAILRAWKGPAAFATQGNFNNDIGLPLMLLRLRADHQVAALELGMNHAGEIAQLAAIAAPTIALVNNAQREHLEFMATVEAVAHENGAVISALPADGIAVFPHDDPFAGVWRGLAGQRRTLTFAINATGDGPHAAAVVCAPPRWDGASWQVGAQTPAGALEFALSLPGQHNVHNALAAASCALAAGAPLEAITRGLATFEPVKGRSRRMPLVFGAQQCTLIDDSYNANPDSVDAALLMLAQMPAPRLMVLGDMGEVGDQGPQFHAQAGERAHALGIEALFTVGALSASASAGFPGARHFATVADLARAACAQAPATRSMLVKGSRFMRMEQVVDALAQAAAAHAPAPTGGAACC